MSRMISTRNSSPTPDKLCGTNPIGIIVNELDGVEWERLLAIKPIIKSGEFCMSSPIEEAAAAVAETIANPSIPVLAEDLLLVHKLVGEVKAQLEGKPLTLLNIFHVLFNIP